MTKERAFQIRKIIMDAMQETNDATAMQGLSLFPEWTPGMNITAGMRVQSGGLLYRAKQAHIANEGFRPEENDELFEQVMIPLDMTALM